MLSFVAELAPAVAIDLLMGCGSATSSGVALFGVGWAVGELVVLWEEELLWEPESGVAFVEDDAGFG
jgi:hypothetical protein